MEKQTLLSHGRAEEEAMAGPAYDRLTQMDNSFLLWEDAHPSAAMHVASTQIHEGAPLRRNDGSLDIDRIEEYVYARLDAIPRYRQRIMRTPLEGHPIWVDDDSFNIKYHVRHTRLPAPGDERQLKRLVGRVFSQRLDREKPLWELWVIEGLEGDRVAICSKVHHCMVDGVSGAELIQALLRPEPQEKPDPIAPWTARKTPGAVELGVDEIARVAGAPVALAESLRKLARDEDGARHQLTERLQGFARTFGDFSGTTPVPFNQPIGPHRRIDWFSMPFSRIREIRKAVGGTINDVVLATTAGGAARYLSRDRGLDLDDITYRVMTPVSVRSAEEKGALGNRVSAWSIELPLSEPDPLVRLEMIREETRDLKESKAALGGDVLSAVTEWTGSGILSLGARMMNYGTPFNSVVTNVPGPQSTLYLLESKMLEIKPHVPLVGTLGMGIALFSYDGTLSWGFSADWDLVPDLHQLVLATEHAFEELHAAATR